MNHPALGFKAGSPSLKRCHVVARISGRILLNQYY